MKIHILPRALLGLALLAGGLCPSPQAATQAEPSPFPTPSAGMTIEGREGDAPITLEGLLLEFAELTGEHLIWTDDTGHVMKAVRVDLDHRLVLPAEEVYSAVETILIANRFVLVDLRREEPRTMAVHSLDSPARANIRAGATFVPAEDLPLYADHPAILIHTVVHLPNLDVRKLENAMRATVVDPKTMQIVPVPESNQLILTGLGADTVRLVATLRARNENPPEPGEEPAERPEPELQPLTEPPGSLPAAPELLGASEHQEMGELIGQCIEAYLKMEGRRDAEVELRQALEKKWAKAVEGQNPLALTGDLGAALWYAHDYASAEGLEKGHIVDFKLDIPFYGTTQTDRRGRKTRDPYVSRYALRAPSSYSAETGPYPLIVCIPDVDEKPEEHLGDHWSDRDLQDGAILLALTMPEKPENWAARGGPGEPGGIGILFLALMDVRDRYAIDFDKVFLAGRGLGVKVAMEIANSSPDRFAGVIGRAGDAAEIAPDNFSNLPCFLAGGGGNAIRFAEQAKRHGRVQPVLSADAKEEELWDWVQVTTRRSYPEEVVLLAGVPVPNRAYWLEIPPHDGQTVARLTARADRASNTLTINSEGIFKVTVYLNDVLLDLDRKVTVICNGVEQAGQITRNFNTMMEQIYRGRSDPGMLYTASRVFDLPVPE